jgi:hypothetical protein
MGEMVGGWLDKAYSTAGSIADLDEAEYYWARARLADRRKHFAGAEREFRAALEVAPNEVDARSTWLPFCVRVAGTVRVRLCFEAQFADGILVTG